MPSWGNRTPWFRLPAFTRGRFSRDLAGSAAVSGVQLGAGLAVGVVLARLLGPSGYGAYSFALALITLLFAPLSWGGENLAVRFVARYRALNKHQLIGGLLRWNLRNIAIFGLVAGVGISLVAFWTENSIVYHVQLWSVALLILVPAGSLFGSTLRGFDDVVIGQLQGSVFPQVGSLVFLGAAVSLLGASAVTPELAMQIRIVAVATGVVFSAIALYKRHSLPVLARAPRRLRSVWAMTMLPLAAFSAIQSVNAQLDLVTLGWLTTTADVGIYRIAVLGASVTGMAVGIVGVVSAPLLSRLHSTRQRRELQRKLTQMARLTFGATLAAAAIFWIFGRLIIVQVVGSEYSRAALPLYILAVGQVVNGLTGVSGLLLLMAGRQRRLITAVAISFVLNLTLCLTLIPRLGSEGAAIAAAASLALLNIIATRYCWNDLNLNPFPFRVRVLGGG